MNACPNCGLDVTNDLHCDCGYDFEKGPMENISYADIIPVPENSADDLSIKYKVCANCNTQNGPDALYCSECGKGLDKGAVPCAVEYSKDPGSLTRFLKIMLYLSLGAIVVNIISDFMQLDLLNGGYFTEAQAEANDARQQIVGILSLIVFIITGITFLRWIYRANTNCRGFGAQDMRFTPGWSVGYYFIPFANLIRPYQAMKEIWMVSKNPADWQNQNGSALLGWWWALWLVSGFLGQASFRMTMRADTMIAIKGSTVFSIVSYVLDIPLYIVALALISAIYNMQEALTSHTAGYRP